MPEVSRSQLVAYAAFAILVVAVGVRFMRGQQPAEAPAARVASASAPRGAAGGVRVARPAGAGAGGVGGGGPGGGGAVVHVRGGFREPGVYRLPAGARVQDAVERAGGAKSTGDVNAINLAAKVVDGQQVVVPARVRGGAASAVPAGAAAA